MLLQPFFRNRRLSRNLFSRWLLCAACLLCFQLHSQASESVDLSWDSHDTGAAGYLVYYGGSSHTYTNIVYAGPTNQIVISGLNFGTKYYFAAQAYDNAGKLSALSGEISFTAGSATLLPTYVGNSQMRFSLEGTSGKQYIVLGSTNLVAWTPVYTNTAPFLFTNTPNSAMGQQYFRACRYN